MPATQEPSSPKTGTAARIGTILTARAPQIIGLYLAVRELGREQIRESAVVLIALCIMGVEAAKELALGVIDRIFGPRPPK